MQLIRLFPLLALTACSSKTSDSGTAFNFDGGNFQFTNTSVSDSCLDGAMTLLFLPEGDGTTNDWQDPTELPAWDALPATYTIKLQDPFSDNMEVTVTEGTSEGLLRIEGSEQPDVYFDEENYSDCTIDMLINADVVIDDNSSVHGTADITVSDISGDTCPTFDVSADAGTCAITLDFTGALLD